MGYLKVGQHSSTSLFSSSTTLEAIQLHIRERAEKKPEPTDPEKKPTQLTRRAAAGK